MAIAFTVVIPLHDKGPHIERAVRSALAQTHLPVEIIVVDDASTDDGPARVTRIGDPRIRVVHRDEPGPGGYAARNLAIGEARTDWIAFLDADDEWQPDHLNQLSAVIEAEDARSPGLAVAFAGFRVMDPGNRTILDPYTRRHGEVGGRFGYRALVELWLDIRSCPIWTSATAARRDALIAAGLFPAGRCRRGGDKDLWLRLARQGDVARAPRVTATYWRDSVNMVTGAVATHHRHCMCDTIRVLLRAGDDATGPLLRRLYNLETFIYGRQAARSRAVDPAAYEGFYVRDDPIGYITLRVLSTPLGWRLARAIWRRRTRSETRAGAAGPGGVRR
jgi:glycosyltransferase involved in cell wall biosynthesis